MGLTAARNTPKMNDVQRASLNFPIAASTKVYEGSLVTLEAGYLTPGEAEASTIAVGRCHKTVDNTAGADGALSVDVDEGIFKWNNNDAGSDPVVAADVGSLCYIEDDKSVCHTSTTKSAAGRVIKLDADGVWVRTVLGQS